MADLVYSEARFDELIARLDQNIRKIEGELEAFEQNYQVIKANWSGSEFEKADQKLLEIKKTLETALTDNKTQKTFLESKNADFARQTSGL